MAEIIGVTVPVSGVLKSGTSEWYSELLKHQYMLVDRICIPALDTARRLSVDEPFFHVPHQQPYDLEAEIEWLEEVGVVCQAPTGYDSKKEESTDAFFGSKRYIIREWVRTASERLSPKERLLELAEIQKALQIVQICEAMERLTDALNGTVVSLVDMFDCSSDVPIRQPQDALRIVLHRIPIPRSDIPWDDLIAFRREPDVVARHVSLKRWMRKMSKGHASRAEIGEELEWLIQEYTRYLELQKIKYQWARMEALVSIPLEVLENLVKIKWSKVAESLFAIRAERIKALEAEFNAPGREISYVVSADRFLRP